MDYLTISNPSEGYFEAKKSKFLAFIYPIFTEVEVKEVLNNLRKLHPKAVHFCYGYKLGFDGKIWKANDDGEPSKSAGLPILGQLTSAKLTNTLIVVVRYYGGVNLGVGGLQEAYKSAAKNAIEHSEIISKTETRPLSLTVSLNNLDKVTHFISKQNLEVASKTFTDKCTLLILIPLDKFTYFEEKLSVYNEL